MVYINIFTTFIYSLIRLLINVGKYCTIIDQVKKSQSIRGVLTACTLFLLTEYHNLNFL